jgi:hypothetical protein
MGDGLEPVYRLFNGAIATGLVGLVHGGLDATETGRNMPNLAHQLLNYVPLASAATYVASSRYGLQFWESRTFAGAGTTLIAGITEMIGYTIGVTGVSCIRSVINK